MFAGNGDGSITQSPAMSGRIGRFTFPFLAGGSLFGWDTPDLFGWLDRKRWFLISDLAGLGRGFTTSLAFTTILALALLPISAYVLWRTPFGLRLRSIGEKPSAADSLGVAVNRFKYIGVTISGVLAGLGGAWLAIDIRAYNQDQVAGRGFQGLAALIFGNWRPAGIGAGAGLFAFAQSLTQRIGTNPVRALFLLATLFAVGLAVVLFARRRAPASDRRAHHGRAVARLLPEPRRRWTPGSCSSRPTWSRSSSSPSPRSTCAHRPPRANRGARATSREPQWASTGAG